MNNIFIGKFSDKYPEQIEGKICYGGDPGSQYYGNLQVGDYVFPVFKGQINSLWKFRGYENRKNDVTNKSDVAAAFDEIVKFPKGIRLAAEFTRYKYFKHNLNLLNKSSKSIKGLGFIQIELKENSPYKDNIELLKNIDFQKDFLNFYISYEDSELEYKDGDVIVRISRADNSIKDIVEFDNGEFKNDPDLYGLYREKNKAEERYTLDELVKFAVKDNASFKKSYLESVLRDLRTQGYFKSPDPIKLYDNLLVGRKRTVTKPAEPSEPPVVIDEDVVESEDDLDKYSEYAKVLKYNPNIILYGPPGTGKTYSSKKIIEAMEYIDRGKKVTFKEVEEENRAVFITFHQAYSYEEFIEGIRPELMSSTGDEVKGDGIRYKIEDGILKKLVNLASLEYIKETEQNSTVDLISPSSKIWKVSLGAKNSEQNIYNECKYRKDIAVGWFPDESLEGLSKSEIYKKLEGERESDKSPSNDAHTLNIFVNEMNKGDIVLIYHSPEEIRDIGVIEGDYSYDTDNKTEYNHRRKVKWIKEFKTPANIYNINGNVRLTLKTVYELPRINISDIRKLVYQDEEGIVISKNEKADNVKPYYLIIDEINRGNISKIFGELITLIEKDKRNSASCILPYSQKSFSVPDNIYIIGTMNTADRSISLMDTALRRRFAFMEVEPDSDVLNDPNIDGAVLVNESIDLCKLLDSINHKILEKLDRDHRIGHSYFMSILTLDDLYFTWYYKILPLLNEYFYNDVTSLSTVVGKAFYDEYGNVKFLSRKSGDGVSEFEKALINIYNKGE